MKFAFALFFAAATSLFAQDAAPNAMPAASPTPAAAVDTTAPVMVGVAPTPKISYFSTHVNGNYIALTFDDGPHPKLTPKLLALLADRHIKVTFFLIGENVHAHPEIVRDEVAQGHVVGNHSWSHPNLRLLTDDELRTQIGRTDDEIKAAIGHSPKLLRPPYGELSKAQRLLVNKEYGYKIIFWDVDPLDWKDPGPSVVASRILSQVRPGSIILSHDIHAGTVEAMPQVIDTLLQRGYKFVTVPELIAMDHPVPKKAPAAAAGSPAAMPAVSVAPAGTP